jgi:hypothetical protein
MYVPPFDVILKAIGVAPQEIKANGEITVPTSLFKFLLQRELEQLAFNEAEYVAANPDVAEAVKKGKISSAQEHFVTTGYFECRPGAFLEVNEAWYKKKYPDVANAIKIGRVASASEHYRQAGVMEFRAPSASLETVCERWQQAVIPRKPVSKSGR